MVVVADACLRSSATLFYTPAIGRFANNRNIPIVE